jgi:hypothetical protein
LIAMDRKSARYRLVLKSNGDYQFTSRIEEINEEDKIQKMFGQNIRETDREIIKKESRYIFSGKWLSL